MSSNNPIYAYQLRALNKEYSLIYIDSINTASTPASSSPPPEKYHNKRKPASGTAARR